MTHLVKYKGAFKKFQALTDGNPAYAVLKGMQPSMFGDDEVTFGYVKHAELREFGYFINREAQNCTGSQMPHFHHLAMEGKMRKESV